MVSAAGERMQEMEIAREAASQAAAIVRRYFDQGVTMRSKESHNLVSDADVESERAIARVIRDAFPGRQNPGSLLLFAGKADCPLFARHVNRHGLTGHYHRASSQNGAPTNRHRWHTGQTPTKLVIHAAISHLFQGQLHHVQGHAVIRLQIISK